MQENVENYFSYFEELSEDICNKHHLQINGYFFLIREIEFYLNKEEHPDIFTHNDELQLSVGKWYFHRKGNSYKSGTYKGLDITFSKKGYGGILIRSIENSETKEYIEGPCNVVNTILKYTECDSIGTLVSHTQYKEDVFSNSDKILSVIPCEPRDEIIYASARVGLTARKKEHLSYIFAPYRFLTRPLSVRKGRQHFVLELHSQDYNLGTISRITGCSQKQCMKWIAGYKEGSRENDPQKYMGKKLSAEEFSRFYGLMKENY